MENLENPDKTTFQSYASRAARALGVTSEFLTSDTEVTDWKENKNPPTTSALNSKITELKAEYDARLYARNRELEYPDWGTQLNKIYDDGVTKWKSEMVDPVKAKWPKDNSGPK